ncbi:dolichyl-diphosphooligosaccharide--protein glycosyltransferase subunit 1 isoform X1 [Rhinolophus ferrumequinum]|uniref:dolichyl-diphosphooligosaccharide--protein glycosyltransferase subunit 1 isoform X1 n=1 Tax=Rhinolophus ferrumequinum TaxID=59479 RepID=UPI00140F4F9F|nr:dolichyl-diphosphooligosaccharide--protein glycosyltransferase subunit 1 isoform X1 [Rhinolophus ferrumequinum]
MEVPAIRLLLLLLFWVWAPAPSSASPEAPPLVNEDVKRTVDLSSHLAKVTAEVVLAHPGGGSTSRASSFLLALEPELEARLAYLGVQVKGEDEEENNLEVQETKIKGKSGKFFIVKLPVALDPGTKISVIVETVYTHVLQPYPTQITQSEKQFVVFEGNHYFYSPYPTKTQMMRVKLASRNVESYTKLGNPTRSEDLLDYGPFRDIPAYSQDTFKVHYENNSPFLTITSMTRVIEVSHWGNIAVEENVDLKHTGAVLKGPFSRYDYQRQPDSGISSIRSFKTILPAAAQDVYYRDEIGNVSTSHLLILDDSVEMEIRPRFPLFGGWKTHYIVGYNLPSYEYLYNLGDQYALKMRFVDHVFDEQVIDSLTVKIILPEGAKNIQVDSPYEISRAPDELHYTYLDTFGRPVIVAYKKNLVEQHIQDIVVHYTFNKVLMLQEPLLVVAAFYILFFTVIIYVRLDFSITKLVADAVWEVKVGVGSCLVSSHTVSLLQDPAAEAKMKVACITEQVLTLVNKRIGLYRLFDETVNRYKQSRDVSTLNSGKKSLETEHKALTSEIALLQSRLKTEGSDLCDKVSEMQKLDAQVKELVLKSAVEAERLVAGKLKKDTYIENEKLISGKRQELVTKIDHILDAL